MRSVPVTVILLACTVSATAESLLSISPGPYSVGFSHTVIHDAARNSVQDLPGPRTIQLSWWYPAGGGAPMVFDDYVRLIAAEPGREAGSRENGHWDGFVAWVSQLGDGELDADALSDQLADLPVNARLNAQPLAGPFPLIVFPERPAGAAVLAESLASRGFVVASFPIQGTWESGMELAVTAMETTAADIAVVARHLQREAYVDDGAWTAMGLGFNASAALMAATNNQRIAQVISLEGGITTMFESEMIERASAFSLYQIKTPMLVIHAPHPSVDVSRVDRYRYSERVYAFFPQMTEFYFLSFGALETRAPGILGESPGDTLTALDQAATLIEQYLNEPAQRSQLADHVDPDHVELEFRAALPHPPSIADWTAMMVDQGYVAVIAERARLHGDDPLPVSLPAYRSMFRALHGNDERSEELQQLLDQLVADYPQSVTGHYSLGRLHQQAGRSEQARDAYEQAMENLSTDPDPTLGGSVRLAYHEAIQSRLDEIGPASELSEAMQPLSWMLGDWSFHDQALDGSYSERGTRSCRPDLLGAYIRCRNEGVTHSGKSRASYFLWNYNDRDEHYEMTAVFNDYPRKNLYAVVVDESGNKLDLKVQNWGASGLVDGNVQNIRFEAPDQWTWEIRFGPVDEETGIPAVSFRDRATRIDRPRTADTKGGCPVVIRLVCWCRRGRGCWC